MKDNNNLPAAKGDDPLPLTQEPSSLLDEAFVLCNRLAERWEGSSIPYLRSKWIPPLNFHDVEDVDQDTRFELWRLIHRELRQGRQLDDKQVSAIFLKRADWNALHKAIAKRRDACVSLDQAPGLVELVAEADGDLDGVDTRDLNHHRLELVKRALRLLTPGELAVFTNRYLEPVPLSTRKMAHILGRTQGAVRAMLKRAVEKVRDRVLLKLKSEQP